MARISTSSATQLLASGVSSTKDQAADLETYVLEAMAPREKPAINTLAGSPPYSVQIRRTVFLQYSAIASTSPITLGHFLRSVLDERHTDRDDAFGS